MKAEIRHTQDYSGEYEDYLVIVINDKSLPYIHIPEDFPDEILDEILKKLNEET